jgi:hypothetical protein
VFRPNGCAQTSSLFSRLAPVGGPVRHKKGFRPRRKPRCRAGCAQRQAAGRKSQDPEAKRRDMSKSWTRLSSAMAQKTVEIAPAEQLHEPRRRTAQLLQHGHGEKRRLPGGEGGQACGSRRRADPGSGCFRLGCRETASADTSRPERPIRSPSPSGPDAVADGCGRSFPRVNSELVPRSQSPQADAKAYMRGLCCDRALGHGGSASSSGLPPGVAASAGKRMGIWSLKRALGRKIIHGKVARSSEPKSWLHVTFADNDVPVSHGRD